MVAVAHLSIALDDNATTVADELITRAAPDPRNPLKILGRLLLGAAGAGRNSKYVLRIDSSTAGASQAVLTGAAVTATITFANVTAGETISIGAVTLTWAAAAANENEVTIGANLAAATANLEAAINAHTKLRGFVSATSNTATGVVTISCLGGSRLASLLPLAETGDALVLSATSFDGDTTDAYVSGTAITSLGIA